jgi:hypothetical protein
MVSWLKNGDAFLMKFLSVLNSNKNPYFTRKKWTHILKKGMTMHQLHKIRQEHQSHYKPSQCVTEAYTYAIGNPEQVIHS